MGECGPTQTTPWTSASRASLPAPAWPPSWSQELLSLVVDRLTSGLGGGYCYGSSSVRILCDLPNAFYFLFTRQAKAENPYRSFRKSAKNI